uniref:Uncharacterized protein n=1 Tax=Oryza glumipatula TaxID=40148 RepID=A0A0D9YHU5_9ORYZ
MLWPYMGIICTHIELRLASSFIIPLKLLANQIAVSRGDTLSFPKGFRTTASSSSLLCCSRSAESSRSPSRASARCLKDLTSRISFVGLASSLNPLLIAVVVEFTSGTVRNFTTSEQAVFELMVLVSEILGLGAAQSGSL